MYTFFFNHNSNIKHIILTASIHSKTSSGYINCVRDNLSMYLQL